MADFAGGKIQAFVGPTELGADDHLEQVMICAGSACTATRVAKPPTTRVSQVKTWGAAPQSLEKSIGQLEARLNRLVRNPELDDDADGSRSDASGNGWTSWRTRG